MKRFTRNDYMNNKCTHEQYYLQYATPGIVARVKRSVNLDILRKCKTDDEIRAVYPLTFWDNVIGLCPADVAKMMRENGDYPTLAGMVCLAKAVANSLR